MNIGIFTGVTANGPQPTELARAVEERGFESLFVAEHTHIPVRVDTPYPDGDEIPDDYARNFDPFVSLSAAASVTERIRLGTAVTLVAQRDPIILAKEVASLDVLSGGRVELGVGAGWLREEIRNHGTDPRTRVTLITERLQAMQRIWADDEAEFHGRFVDFDPIYSWPKPIQHPRPPILLGGWGPTTHQRIIENADGWLAPVGLTGRRLSEGVDALHRLGAERGRSELTITATTFAPTVAELEGLDQTRVQRTLLGVLPVQPSAATLHTLDRYAELAAPWLTAQPSR